MKKINNMNKKSITIVLAAIVLSALGGCSSATENKTEQTNSTDTIKVISLDTTKLAQGIAFYQCPMHPEEISDKPGSCSKCGMDLEKVVKQ